MKCIYCESSAITTCLFLYNNHLTALKVISVNLLYVTKLTLSLHFARPNVNPVKVHKHRTKIALDLLSVVDRSL